MKNSRSEYGNTTLLLGQIYKAVIDRERAFGYNGEDVEMPHVCDEIIRRINEAGEKKTPTSLSQNLAELPAST